MRKTIIGITFVGILLVLMLMIFVGCASTPTIEPTASPIATPIGPLAVIITDPVTIVTTPTAIELVSNISNPEFKYILVQEAGKYYLHKLESWKTENGIIIFNCSICKNTIRVPEVDAAMYKKIGIKICWTANADVCGGEPADWYELLAEK